MIAFFLLSYGNFKIKKLSFVITEAVFTHKSVSDKWGFLESVADLAGKMEGSSSSIHPKQPSIPGNIATSSLQKCATQERLCPLQFVQAKNKVSVMCKDLNFEPEETLRGRVSFFSAEHG